MANRKKYTPSKVKSKKGKVQETRAGVEEFPQFDFGGFQPQMNYGTDAYFQRQNQLQGQGNALTSLASSALNMAVPGTGYALQGASMIGNTIGQKDQYGVSPNNTQAFIDASLNPVGSLNDAIHGRNDFTNTQNLNERTKLQNKFNTTQTQNDQLGYQGQVNRSEQGYLAYGGKMPKLYNMGGKCYPDGGMQNSEVEKQENTLNPDGSTIQFNGPSHDNGGIPANLEPGTLIFSDRIKRPGTKDTYAKLNKPNSTSREDNILDDEKADNLKVKTANLMKQVKNNNSQQLFQEQEHIKQVKDIHSALTKYLRGGMTAKVSSAGQTAGNLYANGGLINGKTQLQVGEQIEHEHTGTLNKVISDAKAGKLKPMKAYYQGIAKDHLNEFKDYYTRLVQMEKEAKEGESANHESGEDEINEYKSGGKHWIQKAVNPSHKGYCTPMTKSTCTPKRKALAMTFKKHHGFHADGGNVPMQYPDGGPVLPPIVGTPPLPPIMNAPTIDNPYSNQQMIDATRGIKPLVDTSVPYVPTLRDKFPQKLSNDYFNNKYRYTSANFANGGVAAQESHRNLYQAKQAQYAEGGQVRIVPKMNYAFPTYSNGGYMKYPNGGGFVPDSSEMFNMINPDLNTPGRINPISPDLSTHDSTEQYYKSKWNDNYYTEPTGVPPEGQLMGRQNIIPPDEPNTPNRFNFNKYLPNQQQQYNLGQNINQNMGELSYLGQQGKRYDQQPFYQYNPQYTSGRQGLRAINEEGYNAASNLRDASGASAGNYLANRTELASKIGRAKSDYLGQNNSANNAIANQAQQFNLQNRYMVDDLNARNKGQSASNYYQALESLGTNNASLMRDQRMNQVDQSRFGMLSSMYPALQHNPQLMNKIMALSGQGSYNSYNTYGH